jgi:hypothetical protein
MKVDPVLAPTTVPTMPGMRMGEVGRFLVPFDADDIVAWFLEHLFLRQRLRERLAGTASGALGPGWLGRTAFERCWTLEPPMGNGSETVSDGSDSWGHVLTLFGSAFAHPGSPLEVAPDPGRCIFVRGYGGARGWNVKAFVFHGDAPRPDAVTKIMASVGDAGPVRVEWESLRHLHRELPAALSGRISRPIAFRRLGHLDVLVVSPLNGRSAYVDLYQGMNPRLLVRPHLEAALRWLVAFQEATERPGTVYRLQGESLGRRWADGEAAPPPWFHDLRERCDRAAIPLCAVHGHFSSRNLILRSDADESGSSGGGACVVDWDQFDPAGSPFTDLFHFPLTYVFNFPWSRYRRRPPVEAFRRGFLEENAVSREVRAFFMGYCSRTGMEPRLLDLLCRMHLLGRARQEPGGGVWLRCQRLLRRADRSVLTP